MQVFCASPWVPTEWIQAHGLQARGVWLAKDSAFDAFPLSAGVCFFAQTVVRLANNHTDAAFVLTSHCDQMRRAFDVLAATIPERVFLLNFPATWQTETAARLFASELERFSRFLVKLGGHVPTLAELREIIREGQQSRRRLLNAAEHVSGRRFAEAVAQFHWDGVVKLPPENNPLEATAMPLAILGGPLLCSHWKLLDAIEDLGGRVVLNATESGELSLLPTFAPGDWHDLAPQTLAPVFLKSCVGIFQRPNTPFHAWLQKRLAACQPGGIILWHYVACDLWRAEAAHLRDSFKLPVLQLEADNAQSCSVRNLGRVQAFLESLPANTLTNPARP